MYTTICRPHAHHAHHAIDAVKIICLDRMLILNVAHQQLKEGHFEHEAQEGSRGD